MHWLCWIQPTDALIQGWDDCFRASLKFMTIFGLTAFALLQRVSTPSKARAAVNSGSPGPPKARNRGAFQPAAAGHSKESPPKARNQGTFWSAVAGMGSGAPNSRFSFSLPSTNTSIWINKWIVYFLVHKYIHTRCTLTSKRAVFRHAREAVVIKQNTCQIGEIGNVIHDENKNGGHIHIN